jgi:hypothetical protein
VGFEELRPGLQFKIWEGGSQPFRIRDGKKGMGVLPTRNHCAIGLLDRLGYQLALVEDHFDDESPVGGRKRDGEARAVIDVSDGVVLSRDDARDPRL